LKFILKTDLLNKYNIFMNYLYVRENYETDKWGMLINLFSIS